MHTCVSGTSFSACAARPLPFLWTGEGAATAACQALTAELQAYPKPGLVSLVDNGSHADMNASHFRVSIASLRPFFAEAFLTGLAGGDFQALQDIGLRAEAAMLRATGGVNTHRGAIFCLGLLAAAAGHLAGQAEKAGQGQALGLDALTGTVADLWGGAIAEGFGRGPLTNGLAARASLGMGGARAEAAAGFPCVRQAGAPALRQAMQAGIPFNAACVQAFFAILAVAEDTALAHRGGREGVDFARREAEGFLATGGVFSPGWRDRALRIHRAFIKRNLSAGGAADLLSAALFCRALTREAS